MGKIVNIVGGGLAGTEAAWQVANRGVKVRLYEMRIGTKLTPAHKTDTLAELVCSNSFRNSDVTSAIGLLHEEMRRLNSLVIAVADETKIPAGSALAMDRTLFAEKIQEKILAHPNIELVREEVETLPTNGSWIIATGPLTSDKLASAIKDYTGEDELAFFDAIAPIITKDSIDFSICWFQSRYDKTGPGGTGKDYINCPMNKQQYYDFVDALLSAEKTEFKDWEKNTTYFNGCLPVEVMAERGRDTLRFGPMKPVGLTNPHSGEKPYAIVQLRQDNKLGTIYNMVGFQTKMKYGAQKQVFSSIPGLQKAEFVRFGGLHRNTFINSPKILDTRLQMLRAPNRPIRKLATAEQVLGAPGAHDRSVLNVREDQSTEATTLVAAEVEFPNRSIIRFAGQVTGVEGYVESAAIGLLAGKFAAEECLGLDQNIPPKETAIGSLLHHITGGANTKTFQPMNINFGLMPPVEDSSVTKHNKNEYLSQRALSSLVRWIGD